MPPQLFPSCSKYSTRFPSFAVQLTLGCALSRSHLLRLQTVYLDNITIFGLWTNTPSPVPAPTLMPPPVGVPTAAPASAPVANVDTGVVGNAVYVQRMGSKGVDIISAQVDGLPLVVSKTIYSIVLSGVVVQTYRWISRQGCKPTRYLMCRLFVYRSKGSCTLCRCVICSVREV